MVAVGRIESNARRTLRNRIARRRKPTCADDSATAGVEEVNKALQEIGTQMYKDAAAAQQQAGAEQPKAEKPGDEKVVDADFEVEDDEKKAEKK